MSKSSTYRIHMQQRTETDMGNVCDNRLENLVSDGYFFINYIIPNNLVYYFTRINISHWNNRYTKHKTLFRQ